MGDYGGKVVKSGYDVDTATPLQQVFNSSLNCIKKFPLAYFTQTVNGTYDVTVTHSLGYKPGFLVWFQANASGKWFSYGAPEDQSGSNASLFVYATDSQIIFRLYSDSSVSVKVAYHLFVDPGA